MTEVSIQPDWIITSSEWFQKPRGNVAAWEIISPLADNWIINYPGTICVPSSDTDSLIFPGWDKSDTSLGYYSHIAKGINVDDSTYLSCSTPISGSYIKFKFDYLSLPIRAKNIRVTGCFRARTLYTSTSTSDLGFMLWSEFGFTMYKYFAIDSSEWKNYQYSWLNNELLNTMGALPERAWSYIDLNGVDDGAGSSQENYIYQFGVIINREATYDVSNIFLIVSYDLDWEDM